MISARPSLKTDPPLLLEKQSGSKANPRQGLQLSPASSLERPIHQEAHSRASEGSQRVAPIPGIIPDSQSPPQPGRRSRSSRQVLGSQSGASVASTAEPGSHHKHQGVPHTIPDSSEEVHQSNRSPKPAELQSQPQGSQVKPSVEGMPRQLPKDIVDTSDEVQRSNEHPKHAAVLNAAGCQEGSTQAKPSAKKKGKKSNPHSTANVERVLDHPGRGSAAVSGDTSGMSAPASLQWPLLNEEGIQHGSAGLSRTHRSTGEESSKGKAAEPSMDQPHAAGSEAISKAEAAPELPYKGNAGPAHTILLEDEDARKLGQAHQLLAEARASQDGEPAKGEPDSLLIQSPERSHERRTEDEELAAAEDSGEVYFEPCSEVEEPNENDLPQLPRAETTIAASQESFQDLPSAMKAAGSSDGNTSQDAAPCTVTDPDAMLQRDAEVSARNQSQPTGFDRKKTPLAKTPFAIRTVRMSPIR